MQNIKHIVIFSHGFGVKKDDRGIFSGEYGIAEELSKYNIMTILFDYYYFNDENSTLKICPFSEQAEKLKNIFKETKKEYPDSIIDIIGHSQGTLIPSLANMDGVRKTILLAPVFDMSIERTLNRYIKNPETHFDFDGESRLPIIDGYTRIIPKDYWIERKNVDAFDLYNNYSSKTDLVLINAKQDTILGESDLSGLNKNIEILSLDGDHQFSGEARSELINQIKKLIL